MLAGVGPEVGEVGAAEEVVVVVVGAVVVAVASVSGGSVQKSSCSARKVQVAPEGFKKLRMRDLLGVRLRVPKISAASSVGSWFGPYWLGVPGLGSRGI